MWFCGCICCAVPIGLAGIIVAARNAPNCDSFFAAWVIVQALFVLLQPFCTLPFYLSPNKRSKVCFMGISVVALIFQVLWVIMGTIIIAGHRGSECVSTNFVSFFFVVIFLTNFLCTFLIVTEKNCTATLGSWCGIDCVWISRNLPIYWNHN